MLEQALTISLIITGLHVCFWEGFIFHKIKLAIANFLSKIVTDEGTLLFIQKPLYDCLPCMGGVYTLIYLLIKGQILSIEIFLMVIAINALIDSFIQFCQFHPYNNNV